MTRDKAWGIVCRYVKNPNLRKHMLAVEAAMEKYWEYFAGHSKEGFTPKESSLASKASSLSSAKRDPTGFGRSSDFSQEEKPGSSEDWRIVGLLHDFDWEVHPGLEEHPVKGEAILKQEGVPGHLRRAILAHADHTGVARESLMEKTLFAVDELTGLIVAVALMKGRRLKNVRVASIEKKWRQKAFARGVNREEIARGARDLGVPLDEHIKVVLEAMQKIAPELGL